MSQSSWYRVFCYLKSSRLLAHASAQSFLLAEAVVFVILCLVFSSTVVLQHHHENFEVSCHSLGVAREASCLEVSSCKKWGSYSFLVLSRSRRGFFLKSQTGDCKSTWGIGWGQREKFHTGLLREMEADGPDAWEKTNLKLYQVNLPFLILVKSFRMCRVDFLLCQLSDKHTCQVYWWWN